MQGLFITATDTDIGKTMLTGAIAAAIQARGVHVGVFKPLASGAVRTEDGRLLAEDATFLMRAVGVDESLRYEVNAVALEPALTPAVAAKLSNVTIDIQKILDDLRQAMQKYEFVLVEGVGGLISPLWEDYLLADMMKELNLPGLLVSKPRLGAINHTVLSHAYAKQQGIRLDGVILNRWEANTAGVLEASNIEYIERLTNLPVVGRFPLLKQTASLTSDDLAGLAELTLDIDKIMAIGASASE